MIKQFKSNKLPDFIGDIHGCYADLERLFLKLGYQKKDGIFLHEERIPVFLGDYINRGPKILEVLNLVRKMEQSGNAYAIMGNHEFNFLAYHYKDEKGIHFRPNTERYYNYIRATIEPLKENNVLEEYLQWMSTLPLIVKSENFNAVHAQWSEELERHLATFQFSKLDELTMRRIHLDTNLLSTVSSIVKGEEFEITASFEKKYKFLFRQDRERIFWWKKNRTNLMKDWLDVGKVNQNIEIDPADFSFVKDFEVTNKPTFFGHYWLEPSEFRLIGENICCLDFSVAYGGYIGAYRFNNDEILTKDSLFHS